jgi:hypothetical protein
VGEGGGGVMSCGGGGNRTAKAALARAAAAPFTLAASYLAAAADFVRTGISEDVAFGDGPLLASTVEVAGWAEDRLGSLLCSQRSLRSCKVSRRVFFGIVGAGDDCRARLAAIDLGLARDIGDFDDDRVTR